MAWDGFLKYLGILIFATRGRDSIHRYHCVSDGSGTRSSHWIPILQSSCSRTFTGRTKGRQKSSGSKRELTVERMPRLVGCLSVGKTLNMNVSESASQCSPSARPIHVGTWSRPGFKAGFALPFSGRVTRSLLLLLANFVRWRPPSFINWINCSARRTALYLFGTDFQTSSTWKLLCNMFITSGLSRSLLWSAVCCADLLAH